MNSVLQTATVGRLVAERPRRARVFEKWGLDYCCGGKKPLDAACAEKALDLEMVLRDLTLEDATEPAEAATDWTNARLSDLTSHIVETHHSYLRRELPRLSLLTQKVRDAHGDRHPQLIELAAVFAVFVSDLLAHMHKEEAVLFPYINRMAAADAKHLSNWIENPIRVMEAEHEAAGEALAKMRELTNGFTPPAGACNTYKAMLDGLAQLEADMHVHVHKENSILFPRAQAMATARS